MMRNIKDDKYLFFKQIMVKQNYIMNRSLLILQKVKEEFHGLILELKIFY